MSGTGLATLHKLLFTRTIRGIVTAVIPFDRWETQARGVTQPLHVHKTTIIELEFDASSDNTQTWSYLSGAHGSWHPPCLGHGPGDWLETRKLLPRPCEDTGCWAASWLCSTCRVSLEPSWLRGKSGLNSDTWTQVATDWTLDVLSLALWPWWVSSPIKLGK